MTSKIKLSFKKQPKETGLRAVGYPNSSVDIKINKKIVGSINAPTWLTKDDKWSIRLMVIKKDIMEDRNPNCTWRNIFFKERFDTEELARNFLKDNIEKIIETWELHSLED